MEEIQDYEGLTHKLLIPEEVNTSSHFAILIGFMYKTCFLLKSKDKSSKKIFLNLINQKARFYNKTMETLMRHLKKLQIENFPSIVNQLVEFRNIFFDTKIFFADTPENFKYYLLSKALGIMIIIKQGSGPDRHYCCSDSIKPIKIVIIQEESRYFPGVNLDETNLESAYFDYSADLRLENEQVLKIFKKIFRDIGNFITKTEKNKLIALINENLLNYTNTKAKGSLIFDLENPSKCENHSIVIFPCGTKHCKSCSINTNSTGILMCSCGIDFSKTQVLNLTTLAPAQVPKVTAPPVNPDIKNSTTGPVIKTEQKIHIGNTKIEPAIIVNCWGCDNKFDKNAVAGCGFDHYLCPNCFEISGGRCMPCNNLNQIEPAIFVSQSNYAQCWGCYGQFEISSVGVCENSHHICVDCLNLSNGLCSPCNELKCAICNNFILYSQSYRYYDLYYHQACVQQLG